jgi:hypothetical protein
VILRTPDSADTTSLPKLFKMLFPEESFIVAAMLSVNVKKRPTLDSCRDMLDNIEEVLANQMNLATEDDVMSYVLVGSSKTSDLYTAQPLHCGVTNPARDAAADLAK